MFALIKYLFVIDREVITPEENVLLWSVIALTEKVFDFIN